MAPWPRATLAQTMPWQQALPIDPAHPDRSRAKRFVKCGFLLPDFEVEIRDEAGNNLPDRDSGTIFLRGPSVMSGYLNDPEATRAVLSEDGWLNTGDLSFPKLLISPFLKFVESTRYAGTGQPSGVKYQFDCTLSLNSITPFLELFG